MKVLKNIFVGLVVSFLGSLPLGYLNVIGVEIFSKLGMNSLVYYLFGILLTEAFVIYFTVIFVNQLIANKKLMKRIDYFAVFFFLLLAYLFYSYSDQSATTENNYLGNYIQYSPFLIGAVLCALNFLQIPFWLGWNLYLTNANYISLVKNLKFYYIFGTLVGTFFGMLVAIVLLDSISQNLHSFSKYIIPVVLPLFFIGLAIYQVFKIHKKYYRLVKE